MKLAPIFINFIITILISLILISQMEINLFLLILMFGL
ncbi:hypothetical protein QR98_0001570 [Sarcoptes scabiei]|uniref:Uncharacterized protein n=1 Tax=Sarcoptes scabiei TaxID=52283 RepID=A0A131ZSQ1_SARSC|nr:hypothetical protein QR98_0001570 [Sarcoptes scabiei]